MAVSDDDDDLAGLSGDERVIAEARARFKRCQEYYGTANKWWREDYKFANADSRNGWQWPPSIWEQRTGANGDNKPALTINKTRTHLNMVINASLQNKSSIRIRPTGGVASYEGSQAMQLLARRIEYISKSDRIYEQAFRHQIDAGVGYVMVETAYTSDRSNDQDIYLRRCKDPLCVFLDPDGEGLEREFAFVFENMTKAKFNRKYPKFKNRISKSTLGNDDTWLTMDRVQVAMYYRRIGTKDTFISYVEPKSAERVQKLASEIKDESGKVIFDALLAQIKNGEIDGYTRDVTNNTVEWLLLGGDLVIERGPWAGEYIPIAECVGVETLIEGQYDRKGLTRSAIDAQRMMNYNASAMIEFGAMQTKSPYVGPAAAFEGFPAWKDANKKNYAYLPYNHIDLEDKEPIPAPTKIEPPQTAPIYMQGMQDAERQLMMVTGQYQAQLGENDQQSAASGKAINERQRQGDTATYDFVEHQGNMLRDLGAIVLDLIPKIYDTERMLHVLGEDGTKQLIKIDPTQKEAVVELKQEDEEAATISFNPSVGEYDCVSDPGPNYATQRQEAWNAISLILQQNMELASTIGDLLFKFGDFPGSEEIMERLQKEIQATKPYLFDDGKDPGMQALQQQMQALQKLNGELVQKLAEMQLAKRGREEKRDVDAFNAETSRQKVVLDFLTKHMLAPDKQQELEHELMKASHDASMQMLIDTNAADLEPPAQMNGAAQ